MDIGTFLAPEHVLVDLQATNKTRLLTELSARAAASVGLESAVVAREILKREELGSTGVGGGAAIPHARFSEMSKPFGILARLRKPINFDAIDGRPVDLIFLILLPAVPTGDQLKVLATVARKLRHADVMVALRRARDSASLFETMRAET